MTNKIFSSLSPSLWVLGFIAFLGFLLAVWGNRLVVLKGIYSRNFETDLFIPCDGKEHWVTVGYHKEIEAATKGLYDFRVYVEVTGEVISNPNLPFGFAKQINIIKVLKVENEIPIDCR